ncbi:MAG: hypothetical protein II749_02310 [Clostridia bacterium]|nr:hypothetical protein [Clostridia bacterium]
MDLRGDKFFRFISEELPEFVRMMFPISERPEDTYLAGLSMGGFGTLLHGVTVLRAGKAHYFSGGMKGGFHFENTIMPCISVHGMI